MKSLIFCLLVSVLGVSIASYYPPSVPWSGHFGPYITYEQPCLDRITNEVLVNFQRAYYESLTSLFRNIVALSDAHFAFSPLTIWQTLAAIAEGTEGTTREQLFTFLGLPGDKCTRNLFYQITLTREQFPHEISLVRRRHFIADSSIVLNRNWEKLVTSQCLINIKSTPYKNNPFEVENWKQDYKALLPHLNLNGNSLVLESADYNGLWETAFTDSAIEPFYNAFGEEIASIEFMKMKKRVKVAFLPSYNMKLLQLPVGQDNRYSILIGLVMGKSRAHAFRTTLDIIHGSVIFEAVNNLKMSAMPIEVALPRLVMTSEVDVRRLVEEIGVGGIWSDPYGTRNISNPPAQPSTYIQRVTITLDSAGVRPNIPHYSNLIPSPACDPSTNSTLDPAVGNDFIANRPFLYGLFDSETFICLFAASFSKP